jgi:hypothetical protein
LTTLIWSRTSSVKGGVPSESAVGAEAHIVVLIFKSRANPTADLLVPRTPVAAWIWTGNPDQVRGKLFGIMP